MLKVRITYTQTEKGKQELEDFLELLEEQKMFEVINISKEYKGRGASKFSNTYIDIDYK